MKTKFILAFLVFSIVTLNKPQAQIKINFNVGAQPVWGPVGYDRADNYYLPDIETYYNVPQREYTYLENGKWVSTSSLPSRYKDYDLYKGYKVVMNEPRPYLHHDMYRTKYVSFKNRHDQQIIRDSKEYKYYEIKDHPKHGEWKSNGHDNRNKNGRGNPSNNGYNNRNNGNNNGNGKHDKDEDDKGRGKKGKKDKD